MTTTNLLHVYDGMLVGAIHEELVENMQERARMSGVRALHVIVDGIGYGLTQGDVAYVDRVFPLTTVSGLSDGLLSTSPELLEVFSRTNDEIRNRSLVHADARRLTWLSDGGAFGVEADPSAVTSMFVWATHPVSAVVPWEVADAVEDAWGGFYFDSGVSIFDWLARWANTPLNGFRPRFLPPEAVTQLAIAALRETKAARA